MELPSKSMQQVVDEMSRLPGIGKKTALRLALHLLKRPQDEVDSLGNSILALLRTVKNCRCCGNITDEDTCDICLSTRRNRALICLVEDTRDLISIERTQQYNGLYHVLGGIINPLAGIGPSALNIPNLFERLQNGECKEVIMALPGSMEGETTAFYIAKKLQTYPVKITNIARGIPIGGELEYADDVTLARSLQNRVDYLIPQH